MQAAVFDRYGPPDVVRVATVTQPTPRPRQVLVRVRAAAVTSGDARLRASRFPKGFRVPARLAVGITRPRRRVLGSVFSGVVEAVGSSVTDLAVGDEVCGMAGAGFGAHAELVVVAADKVTRKPAGVSHEDAAGLLFGGTTALHYLRDKARVRPGQSVLVNGASGAVGTNAVQLAKHFGATVTAVTSTANVELVRQLGADRVIDHHHEDLSRTPERFDVVMDTVGNLSRTSGRRLLAPGGVLLLVVANLWETVTARGNVIATVAPERVADFDTLLALVVDGRLTVVHDAQYPLTGIAEAHRRVDSGRKRGNIVVTP